MDKGDKKDHTFLLIPYEQMKDNPLAKLIQIWQFAGLSVDIEVATRSIKQSQ
ncbi:MAG: sulfotransferase domain-containing protein [Trichodesmium sp. St17_bin3_1_1]|nr:sulfotransferase domain-containing protein [Trichodesmium sp. St18_bin1]MDE5107692.1 sulfotransferase domain-containing protein [Trichodesmium sp. St17_bin3_1_1]MDE5119667.1 sulfotransferase domain-containing protein [Trichodesmium sp. St19_bin1]